VAAAVLSVAFLAVASMALGSDDLSRSNAARLEARSAMDALAREVEIAAAALDPRSETWARDLLAAFAPPHDGFPTSLEPWEGESAAVRVELYADETLSDRAIGVRLGMPRDLDSDGSATSTDVSRSARMLPVVVRARWRTSAGPRQLTSGFYVLGY
jgi:hypothetical protein